MKHLIKIKNFTFNVSNNFVSAITKNNLNFQVINHKGKQLRLLDDSGLSSFKKVPTTSQTHLYVRIGNSVKLRVNKYFFEFIMLHTKQCNIAKIQKTETVNLPPLNMCNIKNTFTTPLGWVGNKSKICSHIFSTIPKVISNYFEPFLGSGSVLLFVLQQQLNGNITILNKIVVSDFNKDLINFFKILQQNPKELYMIFANSFVLPFDNLKGNDAKKDFYYGVRSDFNLRLGDPSVKQAARFLFLNKTSYGSIFRVNSKGFYNTPFGYRIKPAFPNLTLLTNVSKLIEKVCFLHQKFDPEMDLQKGDFIYLDPPYYKVNDSSFVSYVSSGFSKKDSLLLLGFCENLIDKGCFFTLSNSTEIIPFAKNYKTIQYRCKSIKGHLNQLLITNSHGTLI